MAATLFEKPKANIRNKQKEQLRCMLNLECEISQKQSDLSSFMENEDPWKILIYDKACQNILAPLFNVSQLQSYGITLYLLIDSKRQKVPNVPALYFVQPTIENLDIIANDMKEGLYDKFYLNFSMRLERKNLEYLANKLIDSNSYHKLGKVYDQYVNFVSISDNLFDLNIKDCYQNLHKTGVNRDNIILSLMDEITQSLFCSIVTLQKIPIIRAQRGNAAQRIAEQLTNKLTKHLQSRNNLFSQSGTSVFQNRPVMILLDRSIDFAQPLHHSPIYQSLLHDLMKLEHNMVNILNNETNKRERILLDYENDKFWRENALNPFPKVHLNHDELLKWYKEKQDEMGGKSMKNDNNNEMKIDNGSSHDLLKQAINLVPEIVKRKEEIDRHFKLLKKISEVLSQRSFSDYFHIEDELLHKMTISNNDDEEMEKQLQLNAKGIIEDKLRLLLIYWLCNDKLKQERVNELITLLSKQIDSINSNGNDTTNDNSNNGNNNSSTKEDFIKYFNDKRDDLKPLIYLKAHKKLMALGRSTMHTLDSEEKENSTSNNAAYNLLNSVNWGKQHLSTMIGKVKEMLPLPGECVVTKIAKRMLNCDAIASYNFTQRNPHLKDLERNYVTFDPVYMCKNKIEIDSNKSFMKSKNNASMYHDNSVGDMEFDTAIIFMVGGGCLSEFANLVEFGERKKKTIIYGCTDLLTPNGFLNALTEMADS